MRFYRQLFIGQSASILATLLTAVVAIVAIDAITRNADHTAASLAADITVSDQLRLDAERLVSTSRAYLLSGEESYKARFQEVGVQIASTLDRLSARPRGDTSAIENAARSYVRAVREAADQRSLADDPKAILEFFDREIQPRRAKFERAVDTFVGRERENFDRTSRRANRLASRTKLTVVVSSLFALALGIGMSVLFTRTLTRQLRRVEAATTSAQRAAASREELLNIVSHDLRSPLHTIVLGTSLLRETTSRTGQHQRTLASIEHATARMTRLIDDLFDRANIEKGKLELRRDRWDAATIVRDAIELFQSTAAEQHITLRAEIPGSVALYVDRDRILQVFSNLIGNALSFVDAGGGIAVKLEPGDREIRFVVEDTGPGVPSDQLPHIFDRYYQGERRDRTHGLGLYICRLLVEHHHGRIGVDSPVGSGASFWFTLPAGPMYLT